MKILVLLCLLFGSVFAQAKVYPTGLVVPKDWQKKAKFSSVLGAKLPDSFDWRTKVAKAPMIKNQGSCGSCWAFATSTVMEWVMAIAKKGVELSPQELVSCDSTSYGCGGGFFTAFDYEKMPGLSLEADYPYTGSNSSCNADDVAHGQKIVSWAYVGQSNRAPSTDEIKAAIYTSGPVAVTVCANGSFMNYKSGIHDGGGGCQNHMVTLVGYDSSEEYWILQNSWGSSWGEDGYMKIKFGANGVAQVAAFAVYKP